MVVLRDQSFHSNSSCSGSAFPLFRRFNPISCRLIPPKSASPNSGSSRPTPGSTPSSLCPQTLCLVYLCLRFVSTTAKKSLWRIMRLKHAHLPFSVGADKPWKWGEEHVGCQHPSGSGAEEADDDKTASQRKEETTTTTAKDLFAVEPRSIRHAHHETQTCQESLPKTTCARLRGSDDRRTVHHFYLAFVNQQSEKGICSSEPLSILPSSFPASASTTRLKFQPPAKRRAQHHHKPSKSEGIINSLKDRATTRTYPPFRAPSAVRRVGVSRMYL
ncbi:hypothetical protein IWZ03DRAFT_372707 [Phyllosticta citriasiana]|uniref:Uncharacterized protein n=1 Tax=Phyllosticta citriasiana TaxID=595635 RepID=A0ABR1KTD5_9PEZI